MWFKASAAMVNVSEGMPLTTHNFQMTAFKTASNTVGGIAFGLFLVFAVPGMAVLTLNSGFWSLAGTHQSIYGKFNEEDRSIIIQITAFFYLLFLASCAGDFALMRLLMKLNKDSQQSRLSRQR